MPFRPAVLNGLFQIRKIVTPFVGDDEDHHIRLPSSPLEAITFPLPSDLKNSGKDVFVLRPGTPGIANIAIGFTDVFDRLFGVKMRVFIKPDNRGFQRNIRADIKLPDLLVDILKTVCNRVTGVL